MRLTPEEFDEMEKITNKNVQLSRGGQRMLEERQAQEMLNAAKEEAHNWQSMIDDWNRVRNEENPKKKQKKHRGLDGMVVAMVLEVYSRMGSLDSACRICGVGASTMRKLGEKYPQIKDALSNAKALYAGRVQAKLTSIVFDGMEEKVYDKEGNLIRRVHKESEQLIKLAAEGAMPEKYGRNKQEGGTNNIPIQINMYLDKEEENAGSQIPTVQVDAEGLPTPRVEIPDVRNIKREEERLEGDTPDTPSEPMA